MSLAGELLWAVVCAVMLVVVIGLVAWIADRITRWFERRHGDRLPASWSEREATRVAARRSGQRFAEGTERKP